MRSYVKRISKKLSKLSREQLELLVNESLSENESLYAIMESLSTGLIIVDNHFYLQQSNTIVESQLAFSTFLDSQEVLEKPIWEFISDKDIIGHRYQIVHSYTTHINNKVNDFISIKVSFRIFI